MLQEKYATLAALHAAIIDTARSSVEDGDTVPALIFLAQVNPEGGLTTYSTLDAGPYMASERTKQAFAATMDDIMADDAAPINAIIFISESWMSSQQNVPPSQDPNRTEGVVVVTRTRGLDAPASRSQVYDINRENKTLIERVIPDMQFGGRFTGKEAS